MNATWFNPQPVKFSDSQECISDSSTGKVRRRATLAAFPIFLNRGNSVDNFLLLLRHYQESHNRAS